MILLTILFPVVVYADQAIANFEGASQGDEVIVWGPYLTNTSHSSAIIHWKTLEPSIGRVGFALSGIKAPGISDQSVSEKNSSQFHEVQLNNLSPGQRYSYCIGNNSGNYSFRTLPPNGPFTFIVYGDTREQLPWWNQSTHHALVAARIAKEPDCLFVVHTGDFVNDPADEGEWGRFFEAAGPMLANTTFYPVPGNHEGNLTTYQERFGMPQWYSFQCSDARFIVLNSNSVSPVIASAQDQWLNETLDKKSTWNFVFLHHPLYTSEVNHWGGFSDIQEKWGPAFQAGGVDAVFSAHVHAYEHFYEKGIHYFTVATGGAPPYALSPDKPDGYVNSRENTLGYMRVTVNSQQVLLEFIPVAEVRDKQITVFPAGTVGETVMVRKSIELPYSSWTNGVPKISPLFIKEIRIFLQELLISPRMGYCTLYKFNIVN
jgi:hypothetical protein